MDRKLLDFTFTQICVKILLESKINYAKLNVLKLWGDKMSIEVMLSIILGLQLGQLLGFVIGALILLKENE